MRLVSSFGNVMPRNLAVLRLTVILCRSIGIGLSGRQPFAVENALRKQSGLPADFTVVDGQAEQGSQTCELR